jgi:hypothetical protein
MTARGLIAYYGLSDWWHSVLTEKERAHFVAAFHPLGDDSRNPLTDQPIERIVGPTATPSGFLSQLIGWLGATPEDDVTRSKVRIKLAELTRSEPNPIARHFSLQVLIGQYYYNRNRDPEALPATIAACQDQIAIAPAVARAMQAEFPGQLPCHVGYERLAIILEKDGKYAEAIDLCRRARDAGWNGDWDKRIPRCERRLAKASTRRHGA